MSSSSTHTATPQTVRPSANGRIHTLAPFTPSQSPTPKPPDDKTRQTPPHSASSSSIASTATSRTVTPHTAERDRERAKRRTHANGHANGHAAPHAQSRSRSRADARGPSAHAVIRRSSFGAPATESNTRAPSTLALIRASFESLVQNTSRSRVVLYAVLFVVVPVVSFVLRLRRRRARADGGGAIAHGSVSSRTVDAVRKRLRGVDGQRSVVGQMWEEVARAVLDTVRMAGRGLV